MRRPALRGLTQITSVAVPIVISKHRDPTRVATLACQTMNNDTPVDCRIPMGSLVVFFSPAVVAQDSIAHGYDHWGANFLVAVATAAAVCICVLLHYEVLNFLSRRLGRLQTQSRRRVLFAIFGVLSVHVAEIWIFGLFFCVLLLWPSFGTTHPEVAGVLDRIYLSAMTFTTVGAGEAYALSGPIRFLAGTEALAGLVLITWSASFTFLEMERFWRDR